MLIGGKGAGAANQSQATQQNYAIQNQQQLQQLTQRNQALEQAAITNNSTAMQKDAQMTSMNTNNITQAMANAGSAPVPNDNLQPNDGLQTVATSLRGITSQGNIARRTLLGN